MQREVEPGGDPRRDCVRLIERLIVYPTDRVVEWSTIHQRRDNCPNRAANTWSKRTSCSVMSSRYTAFGMWQHVPSVETRDEARGRNREHHTHQTIDSCKWDMERVINQSWRRPKWGNKLRRAEARDHFWFVGRSWTNSPPIRYEGSVEDYLAVDGERGIGVRYRRGSLRDGYHDYGQQQARKLPNARSARQRRDIGIVGSNITWFDDPMDCI